MISYGSSGCCDSYRRLGHGISSGSNLVDIQSFLEIGKIGDSGRISGRARETSEIEESNGSEYHEDRDNDDELDEGKSEKLSLNTHRVRGKRRREMGEDFRGSRGSLGIWCGHRWSGKDVNRESVYYVWGNASLFGLTRI